VNDLPLMMVLLGGAMTLTVAYLGISFWLDPVKGMAFATHRPEGLPQVMVNRYFVIMMMIGGSLYYGRPEVVAFSFAVTGIGPAHDAWIYYRLGQPYKKHLIPAALSAVVAIWAFTLIPNAGAV